MKKISLIFLSVLMLVLLTSCGRLGDYKARIESYALVKDSYGNDAVIINYRWTNNAEDDTAFFYAITDKVFQDGVECEKAMISDNIDYHGYDAVKSIKPGETLKLQLAYVLHNIKSPISVELKEAADTDSKAPKVTRTFKLS